MTTKATDPEKLIDYLYREADARAAKSVEAHLEACQDDQRRVEAWKQTMACLDAWTIEAESRSQAPGTTRWFVPLLQIAAVMAILLGLGFLLGKSQGPDPDRLAAVEREVEKRFAGKFEEAHARWAAKSEAMEKQLLLASGSNMHQEAQALAERALQQLARNERRNETLVLLLPPEEQALYRQKKAELERRAQAARHEAAKTQGVVQQIVSRAAKRAAPGPH